MNVHISGDTLALDPKLRRSIEQKAEALIKRFPDSGLELRIRLAEEFDNLHGHRVRCEIDAMFAQQGQVIVREARKKPEEAIDKVFGAAKGQLRKLRMRAHSSRRAAALPEALNAAHP